MKIHRQFEVGDLSPGNAIDGCKSPEYSLCGPLTEAVMSRPQAVIAVVVSLSLLVLPIYGAPAPAIGTVTSASGAHIGATTASVGSTVFVGDHLSTEKMGSIQVRAGAARLMLSGASAVDVAELQGKTPAARLMSGTVVFSTANAAAFVLHASKANIRAKTDEPTVGQITYVSDKELRVRCNRGSQSADRLRAAPSRPSAHAVTTNTERLPRAPR